MIVFDEEEHTYSDSSTGEKYISVTTLIEKYKPFFDVEKHSARVANREGVPQEMIKEMWQKENKRATSAGTKIHKVMEKYISEGVKEEEYCDLYASYDNVIATDVKYHENVLCETLLHNSMFKLAGTADLIFENDKDFIVGDFKTNKKFNFTSSYNEYFNTPLEHLTHCEFNTYALQLSLYAFMYEQISRKRCKKLVIFFLDNSKWRSIHCNYLKSDALKLLEHYTKNNTELLNSFNENRDSY